MNKLHLRSGHEDCNRNRDRWAIASTSTDMRQCAEGCVALNAEIRLVEEENIDSRMKNVLRLTYSYKGIDLTGQG